jgi:hypothetical protein
MCFMLCPAHCPWFILTIFGKEYKLWSSSCNFLWSHVTPALLGPYILLSTLFADTLSLCSSHNVWE